MNHLVAEPIKDNLSTCGHLTNPRKQPQEKQTFELIIHTYMVCSLSSGGEISMH